MNDRYDISSNPQAQFEPGSKNRVLRNKLGIRDPKEMDDVELDLLVQLYDDIPEIVEQDQRIRTSDIREWHRRWLGGVYDWAGKDRTVNLSKDGFQFAAAGQVARLMDEFDCSILANQTPCDTMSEEELIEAISITHVELILVHPFREGNGRIARILANVMALQAGWAELDYSPWDAQKSSYFQAIHLGLSDYEPMKTLVSQILHVSRKHEGE